MTPTQVQLKTTMIRSDAVYRRVIAAPDAATREQLFVEGLLDPMANIIDAMTSMMQTDDRLGVARAWHYLLPEALTTAPPALVALEQANAWTTIGQALAEGAARFQPYADRFTIHDFTGWIILIDPQQADPQNRGYAGFQWHDGTLVITVDTANDYTLPRLPGAMVHELHHVVRLNVFPWDMQHTSVADYILLEGLAESFATQLYGEKVLGYYATDISDDDLATARALIRDGLDRTGFNVIRGYIFGDALAERFGFEKIGMPRFGGYAVGYRVVQAYLARTGLTVEEATFRPSAEIIRESGYFE